MDVHIGTPDEVIASLQADTTLQRATDLTMQVHSIDPPHPVHPALDRAVRGEGGAGAGLGARKAKRGAETSRMTDVIDTLAGIAPGSTLDAIRAQRPEARKHAQASYDVAVRAGGLRGRQPADERYAVASFVAGLHGDRRRADYYAGKLAASGASMR